tara:strand:- start:639 stop:1277 length:639 start_codon:yes stop_codon:yes gene_type:complete
MATTNTLTVLQARVRSVAAQNSNDGLITDAWLLAALNETLEEIVVEHDWYWLEAEDTITTTASDGTYAKPSDWARTQTLYHEDKDDPLIYLPRKEILIYRTRDGFPRYYSFYKNEIIIGPRPSVSGQTIYHEYITEETTLSAGSSVPVLPDRYCPYLVYKTAVKVGETKRDAALLGTMTQASERWQKLLPRVNKESKQTLRVRPRHDWALRT